MRLHAQDGPLGVRVKALALAVMALTMGWAYAVLPPAEPALQTIALVPDKGMDALTQDSSPPATIIPASAPSDVLALEPTTTHDPALKIIGPPVYEHRANDDLWHLACFSPPARAPPDLVATAMMDPQEVDAIRLHWVDLTVHI